MAGFAISYREIRTNTAPEPKTQVLEPTVARIATDVKFRGTLEVLRFLREEGGDPVEDSYVVFLKLPGRGNFFVPFYVTKGALLEHAKTLVENLASGSHRPLQESELRELHRLLMTHTYVVTVAEKQATRTRTQVYQFNLEETDQPAVARITRMEDGKVLWIWGGWSDVVRVVQGAYAPTRRAPMPQVPTRKTASAS